MLKKTSSWYEVVGDGDHGDRLRRIESFGSDHTLDIEETDGFINYINQIFHDDPLLSRHLPLQTGTNDLFEKVSDGLIFFKLINLAVSGTIAISAMNTGESLSIFQKTENLNVVLRAALAVGCIVVNIGARDIIDAKPIPIMGLLWQLLRIQLISRVHVRHIPALAVLRQPSETLQQLLDMSPEAILIRWMNYHLAQQNVSYISNFGVSMKVI